MKRKSLEIELKADGQEGQFRATFASFNAIDLDGDVTVPGAFQDGQEVRICAWGHNWGALPVGKGAIGSDADKAWVDGQFFLDTAAGLDTYRTVKNLGALQEWSYGFDVLQSQPGKFAGQPVVFLESLDVFEVSPVLLGAGIDTCTESIKGRTLSDQSDEALAAVSGFVTRVKALAATRAKEGRVLSDTNRERLKTHVGALHEVATAASAAASDIEAFLSSTEPAPKSHEEVRGLLAQFLATEARLNGVPIGAVA